MTGEVKVDWLERLLNELGQRVDSDLGQELVRCLSDFDRTGHPSFVDMAVHRSYQMCGALPLTIQALAAHQAKERLRVGQRGHFSPALRAEAKKMAMTTMTSLVAAGLSVSDASLRTAEALNSIYGRPPYIDSTIRRNHLKYRKTDEGKTLAETMRASFEENPTLKDTLLRELKKLPSLGAGVYN